MATRVHRLELPLPLASFERGPLPVRAFHPVQPRIRFDTIDDRRGFDALEPEWRALFQSEGRSHQAFQDFAWLKLWAEPYIDKGMQLRVVTARVDGDLVAIWPLVLARRSGLRILTTMGEPFAQYGDALIASSLGTAGEDALLDHVLSLPADVVALCRIRADAAIAPALRRRFGAPANPAEAPVVMFGDAQDAARFAQRFPGKVRSSRRRRLRRLEERGPVSFTHLGPGEAAAGAIETAFAFKREWARREGIVSPSLRDPRFERVFLAAARAGSQAPGLRVSVLRSGDEVMGVEISLACKGRLIGHVLAPRPGMDGLGLGGVLAEQTVLGALTQGYEAIDLLAPADAYKRDWTQEAVGVGDYLVGRGLRGRLYTGFWLRHGRELAKSLALRLRPALARLRKRGQASSGRATASTLQMPGPAKTM